MRVFRLLLLVAASLLPASAHELQENRAVLVLRDKTHVAITIYVAWGEALHRALAPSRPLGEFLAVYAAMKPEELNRQLIRAESALKSNTHLYLAAGGEIPISNWVWPDAKQVQSLFQQRIMQAMVDPTGHTHEEPLEIHADAVSYQEVLAVRVKFPDEFQKVLVVAYRPNQLWVEPNTLSPAIKF